jgi:hypothetical protein
MVADKESRGHQQDPHWFQGRNELESPPASCYGNRFHDLRRSRQEAVADGVETIAAGAKASGAIWYSAAGGFGK